jgi:hypothetical protein
MERELLKEIIHRLDKIEERLGIIEKDCSTMSNHISFVEKTYKAVKFPLEYVKNKIELLAGAERTPLPVIKNSGTQ